MTYRTEIIFRKYIKKPSFKFANQYYCKNADIDK